MFACLDVYLCMRFYSAAVCVHCKFPRCGTIKAQPHLVLLHNQVKRKTNGKEKKKTRSVPKKERKMLQMHGRKKPCKGAPLVPVSRINHIYSHMHVNKTLVGKSAVEMDTWTQEKLALTQPSSDAVPSGTDTKRTAHACVSASSSLCTRKRKNVWKITQASLSELTEQKARACWWVYSHVWGAVLCGRHFNVQLCSVSWLISWVCGTEEVKGLTHTHTGDWPRSVSSQKTESLTNARSVWLTGSEWRNCWTQCCS